MTDYRRLKVWEKAHETALEVVRAAVKIRPSPYSPLRNQLVRAALSVPANIVEGAGQASKKDFVRFLRYSVNSSREAEYHVLIARDLDLIPAKDIEPLAGKIEQVRKMLFGLIKRIEEPDRPSP